MGGRGLMDKQELLSQIPSVDEILKSGRGGQWQLRYPRQLVVRAIRLILNNMREAILAGSEEGFGQEAVFNRIGLLIEELSGFSLKPCLNATGVVLHTNLGRAVLSPWVIDHVAEVCGSYSNLEYDIREGTRGKRYSHVRGLLTELTGAEAGVVVNNNAAAALVCLAALAGGREVIVSRGELVEIGGSFRIPEVIAAGGAKLREVGATNKTHLYDYERAVTEDTALLFKAHQSNFRMIGFTAEVPVEELVSLGRKNGVPVMFDLGSGSLVDMKPYGAHNEPTIQEVIAAGVDIVTFSGDKLLGGPQAGVIVGKRQLIDIIAKNPLMRAMRIDKMTLAALEATLMCYLDPDTARAKIPTLGMLLQRPEEIRKRAARVAASLKRRLPASAATIEVVADVSQSGGGALAGIAFDTFVVAIAPREMSVNDLETGLRLGEPPVIARIRDDRLILDMRTVRDHEVGLLVNVLAEALRQGAQ
jgi:L-seryl-tRNA(Ser) seleniumtransferase